MNTLKTLTNVFFSVPIVFLIAGCSSATSTKKKALQAKIQIRSITTSQDFSLIAIEKSDGTVEIWDKKSQKLMQTADLDPHYSSPKFVNNDLLAFEKSGLSIWDWKQNLIIKRLPIPSDSSSEPLSGEYLAISQSGRWLSYRQTIWNTKTWSKHQSIESDHEWGTHRAAAFSPDDKLFAIGTYDVVEEDVECFDVTTGKKLWEAKCGQLGDIIFSPDGRTMAVGTHSGVSFLTSDSGKKLWNVDDKGRPVRFIDNDVMCIAKEKTLGFFDIKNIKKLKTVTLDEEAYVLNDGVTILKFVGDEKRLQFQ